LEINSKITGLNYLNNINVINVLCRMVQLHKSLIIIFYYYTVSLYTIQYTGTGVFVYNTCSIFSVEHCCIFETWFCMLKCVLIFKNAMIDRSRTLLWHNIFIISWSRMGNDTNIIIIKTKGSGENDKTKLTCRQINGLIIVRWI